MKDKVQEKTEKKVDEAIDSTIDNATNKNKDKEAGKNESAGQKNNESLQGDELKSYSKFDFVPGDQVIFFEDFSQDNVGDFPALWNTNSGGEVVTLNNYPGHWFQPGLSGTFLPELKSSFGENFTLEFDLIYAPTTLSNAPSFDFIFYSS